MTTIRKLFLSIFLVSLLLCPCGIMAQDNFEREVESVVFVPKGQWVTGLSVSYDQSTQNDYQFLVVENLSGDTYSFKVSPMVCYIFKNDMGAGGKFGYSRSKTKLDSGDIVLGEGNEYDFDNLYSISHDYYGMAIFRNYLSLGHSRRFGFFSELQLKVGGGQSRISKGSGADFSGTYARNFNLGVGLAPGIVVFLNNYSAMEVNVGVLGFDYKHSKQTTDRIYVARHKTKSANFRVNLFSITFGATFYL